MTEDRISRLSERFRRHDAPRSDKTKPNRGRRSFYVDLSIVERIDETFLAVRHELYPRNISKSEFLEELLEFGLQNIDQVSARLSTDPPSVDVADRRDSHEPR